jgi:hypothetical protein
MNNIFEIRATALQEAYIYFDHYIRTLPKTKSGGFDEGGIGFVDNDVDAFRHAYVSAVFAHELGVGSAAFWGFLNEAIPSFGSGSSNSVASKNMDCWNNKVGRKHGKNAKQREGLLERIHDALKAGELITDPGDFRKCSDNTSFSLDPRYPVIVIEETDSGENTCFVDLLTGQIMDVSAFVKAILEGFYPGYHLTKVGNDLLPRSNPDGLLSNNLG